MEAHSSEHRGRRLVIGVQPDRTGKESYSEVWKQVAAKHGAEVVPLDLLQQNAMAQAAQCDGVMWRWLHNPRHKQNAQKILATIERVMGKPVFPDSATSWHYDNKVAQKYMFDSLGVPIPKTWVFWDMPSALQWIESADFPVVFKLSVGAGSSNVALVKSADEARELVYRMFQRGIFPFSLPSNPHLKQGEVDEEKLRQRKLDGLLYADKGIYPALDREHWRPEYAYAYFQEFLPGNTFDTRITVIGDRAFGYRRLNRPDDFRASGSGRIEYDKIDPRCIEIAHAVSRECGFQSMAYDFLYRDGEPVVNEISYTFVDHLVAACSGNWDPDLNWREGSMWPEDAILEDFVARIRFRSGTAETAQRPAAAKPAPKAKKDERVLSTEADRRFSYWFSKLCIADVLQQAKDDPPLYQGRPLDWDAAHEVLAYHVFSRGTWPVKKIIHNSVNRYPMLDAIWDDNVESREQLDAFYEATAQLLPWGHGTFLANHAVAERRENWLRRLDVLQQLKDMGAQSVLDYGAGSGHTSLLALNMGFSPVVHHEYEIFHPFVAWRAKLSQSTAKGELIMSAPGKLPRDVQVDAVVCSDVAEHVYDLDELMTEIRTVLKPGGVMAWVSVFGVGIKQHLHGEVAGKEEEFLRSYGFVRKADLNANYLGFTGVFEMVEEPGDKQGSLGSAAKQNGNAVTVKPQRPTPRASECVYKGRGGRSMFRTGDGYLLWLDPERYLDQDIIAKGYFEEHSTALVKGLLKPGDVVLDVGGNIGYYTVIFSKLVGSEGRVHSFEPFSGYRKTLLKNIAVNELSNVDVHDFGLSDAAATVSISKGVCSATLHWVADDPAEEFEEIELKRLDDVAGDVLQLEKLDFVKVDVDGHEPYFLAGAMDTLRKYRPMLLVEVSPNYEAAGVSRKDFFRELRKDFYIYEEKALTELTSMEQFARECIREKNSANILLSFDRIRR